MSKFLSQARSSLFCLAFMAAAAAAPGAPRAQDTTTVRSGTSEYVNAFGQCRRVNNSNPDAVMVPHSTPTEWSTGSASFIQNVAGMPNVTISRCYNGPYGSNGFDAELKQCIDAGWNYISYCNPQRHVSRQSSILPVAVTPHWSEFATAISWARSNFGSSASSRPDNVHPACYRNSAMTSLWDPYYRPNDTPFFPGGSDYCIATFDTYGTEYNDGNSKSNSDRVYRRYWRAP